MDRCPHCGFDQVPREELNCPKCFARVSIAVASRPAKTDIGSARIIARLVWFCALVAIVVLAAEGFLTFGLQIGAPQQAAAAAWSCFKVIVPYTIARSIQEMLTA
jgi:hypothetical protein